MASEVQGHLRTTCATRVGHANKHPILKKSRSHGGFLPQSLGHRQFSSVVTTVTGSLAVWSRGHGQFFGWSQIVTPVAAVSTANPCAVYVGWHTCHLPHSYTVSPHACTWLIHRPYWIYESGQGHIELPKAVMRILSLGCLICVPTLY